MLGTIYALLLLHVMHVLHTDDLLDFLHNTFLTQVFYSATLSVISSISICLFLSGLIPISLTFCFNFSTTIISDSYISACPPFCSLSLSLHLIYPPPHLISLMAPFLFVLVSHCLCAFLFLLAVSRKPMTTLRCGLRYTGHALWPCSVHHTTTRCTEPLRHQPSVTSCRHLVFGLAAAAVGTLTITHTHTHQDDHSVSPEFTSQTAAAKLSLLLNVPFHIISQVLLLVNVGVMFRFLFLLQQDFSFKILFICLFPSILGTVTSRWTSCHVTDIR